MSTANIGDVTARLTADTASFDSKLNKSAQVLDRTATAAERASARARAAWEKELLAQEKAALKTQELARAKELAALKSDILSRSIEGETHAYVSQMQATSAAVRALEGNPGIRSVERFLTTIPGVGAALQVAFPVIGAVAFGAIIAENIQKIHQFVKETQEIPKNITDSFRALNDATEKTGAELDVTNDKLAIQIAKLENKPANLLKLALDEDRLAAANLADEIDRAAKSIDEILKKNHIGIGTQIGMGLVSVLQIAAGLTPSGIPGRTEGAETGVGKIVSDLQKSKDKATEAIDNASPDQAASIDQQNRKLMDMAYQVAVRKLSDGLAKEQLSGSSEASLEEYRGALRQIRSEYHNFSAGNLKVDQTRQLEADQAAKQAAADRFRAMEEELNQQKIIRGENIKADYDYWEQRKATFAAGSEQYRSIIQKQAELAVQGARQAAEKIRKFQSEQRHLPTNAEGDLLIARSTEEMRKDGLQQAAADADRRIDSNKLAIIEAQNKAREQEAEITSRAGRSMTEYAAALQLAQVHAEQFRTEMMALEGILHEAQMNLKGLNPDEQQKAIDKARQDIERAQSQRNIEIQRDSDNIYGRDSSAIVGAKDALYDFTRATQDSALAMRNLVNNALNGFNSEAVKAMSGQKTSFGSFGAALFRDISGAALQKGEGSILSMLPFGLGGSGKKPTGSSSDPIYTKSVDGSGGDPLSGLGGGILQAPFSRATLGGDGEGGGGLGSVISAGMGFLGLPGFADGGMIDPGQWAVVGERGPELFHSGGGGSITPNHKLDSMGGDNHFHIDARGSTDPAQTEAAIHRAMSKYLPLSVGHSAAAQREVQLRRPTTQRS